ncbi:hypothetical protein LMH87_011024 [Akanthomyces muscarius]|uniref:Uncharacterized protein n=1 Tax=Akanthomyces muscarius TaxID=2231603 RepID=A0A9W8Q8C1_AKAMU|nr:hypothetical protein LMH87_011024 [Akanthomyces muscarius]KAJ4150267.1 hypothetical protein LMH87_011024 [Akanthomyces muscarius]
MDTVLEVSIKSQQFGTFLSLDGTGVSTSNANGVGAAAAQTYTGPWEHLQIENHANGTFSILSSNFPGSYLRLDGSNLKAPKSDGGGVANCQFYTAEPAGGYEVFKFHNQSDGSKTIESLAFPGVFLRMDGNSQKRSDGLIGVVNGQWGAGPWERFIVTAL